jgi:hypothetical protein
MKIKLIRTGGFIPITKMAEVEVNFTDKELVRLIEVIKPDPSAQRIKDGNYYQLNVGTSSTPVDLEKVPEEYNELFSKLKNSMKIVK